MKFRLQILAFITFFNYPASVKAQFNTIKADTSRVVKGEISAPLPVRIDTVYIEKYVSPSQDEPIRRYSDPRDIQNLAFQKDIPIFVNVTDSLLSGLLQQRMNVCLPLDMLRMTSRYGYRNDPIQRCKKFHDGVDLACNYAYVYSMLPGKVKKVSYGKRGYGNHVVLDHGNLEVLYGHLSHFVVQEGDEVTAGTIVGISGNTGKSTGPHLHIQLRREGKSVDPVPFIKYLEDYIEGLQDKIAYLKYGTMPGMDLTIENIIRVMDQYGIHHQKIVLAQSLLETGYFTSRVCHEYKNLFGLYNSKKKDYYRFDTWEESVKAYKDYIQYRYVGGDYYVFLDQIGYAEDPAYISKVRSIAQAL